jgi:hypothetical protein
MSEEDLGKGFLSPVVFLTERVDTSEKFDVNALDRRQWHRDSFASGHVGAPAPHGCGFWFQSSGNLVVRAYLFVQVVTFIAPSQKNAMITPKVVMTSPAMAILKDTPFDSWVLCTLERMPYFSPVQRAYTWSHAGRHI